MNRFCPFNETILLALYPIKAYLYISKLLRPATMMKRKLFFTFLLMLSFLYGTELLAQESEEADLSVTEKPQVLQHDFLNLHTGSVYTLDSTGFNTGTRMNFASSLEGVVPGLDISPVGNVPGAYTRMLIRGIGSVNGGNEPLIILDGVPFENASLDAGGYRFSGLAELDPDDIESIHILKDASATAIYGSRAANGVIRIITKDGKAGKKQVNFSYRYGISSSPKKLDLLSSEQYMSTLNQAYKNSYPDSTLPAPVNMHTYDGFYAEEYVEQVSEGEDIIHQPNLSNTNWYENLHDQAVFQEFNIGWSGGDEKTQYYIGAGYRGDHSFLYNGKYQRANARVNLLHKAGERLSFGLKMYLVSNKRDVNPKEWFETAHTTALPVYPVKSPNNPDIYWYDQSRPVNIEALNEHSWIKNGGFRTFNTAFLDYKLMKGLSFHSLLSWDFQHYLNEDYKHPFVAPAENGFLIISRYDRSNWSSNNYLNFNNQYGDHHLNVTAGISFENYSWNGNMIHNPGMTLVFVHSNGESNQNRLVGVYRDNYRFYSLYTKADYSLRNKYFARLSLRSDISSKFGEDNRTAYFPAASLAWDISAEDFASGLAFLNEARLRVGYGIVGNAQIGNFNHLSSLTQGYYNSPNVSTNGYYLYGTYPAVVPVNMANPNLGPEKSTQINAGLDFSVLENRFSGSLSFYQYNNSDQLNYTPLSILYGYENSSRWENSGVLSLTGFEALLTPVIVRNENGFNWEIDISVSSVKTVLESLPENVSYLEGYFSRAYEGEIIAGYYLPEWAGVDPETGHELIRDPETGEAVDAELLSDEEFSSYSTYFTDKTPFPKYYGGINNRFSFKGIELSFLFSFRGGHSLLDLGEQSMSYVNSSMTGSAGLTNGWTSSTPTDVPLLYDTEMSHRVTSRFIHDASYMRLQRLNIGYSLPSDISRRLSMEKTKIYISGQNLFTFSSFPGYDPNGLYSAYNSMANMDAGLLMFDPPQPRTILIGIDFTF